MDFENKNHTSGKPDIRKTELPGILISNVTTITIVDTHPSIVIEADLVPTKNSTENDGKEDNGKIYYLSSNVSSEECRGKDPSSSPAPDDSKMDYLSPSVSSKSKDPRMVRSTSLKTTTTTGSPNEKKIVRFADALGLDLADVRHFSNECLPKISKSAFADLKVPYSYSHRSHSRKNKARKSNNRTLVLQFDQPGMKPQFFSRLKNERVCLENVQVNGTTVKGMVMVSNLGFEKMVQVKYTTDNWASKTDITAEFVPSNSTDTSFDRFNFRISVPLIQISDKLIFVIKFTVNGQDYWDNNHENNYILECRSNNS